MAGGPPARVRSTANIVSGVRQPRSSSPVSAFGGKLARTRAVSSVLLLLLLLASCGSLVPPGPETVLPVTVSAPALQTRAEGDASTPCGPLWTEGERVTLRGLYRTSGGRAYLDVTRVSPSGPPCWARFFLDRDLGLGTVVWDKPGYAEVVGLPSSSHWDSLGLWDLQVLRSTVLPLDVDAARAACGLAVAGQSAALRALDWSALALPGFVTGTAGFRPTPADLSGLAIQLDGADDRRPLLVLTARGPDLPEVHPLVHRWIALECVVDLESGQALTLTATIRGEVQE